MAGASDMCWAVAFYGIDGPPEALASLYAELVRWLDAQDARADEMSVHGRGFSGKVQAFPSLHARLEKRGFDGVEAFSLFSLLPGATLPIRDWKVTADVSLRDSDAVVAADASVVTPDAVLDVARTAVRHLRPVYGIGYRRERRLGPSLYAAGISYGIDAYSGPEYEESLAISRWSDAILEEAYRLGMLRDVYPWNFLTRAQLTRPVDGVELEEWIARDADRGELASFEGEVSLWTLEEASIPPVREALMGAGLIFEP